MSVLAVVASLLVPAEAATREVCFRLKIRDDRVFCAQEDELGARRPCESDVGSTGLTFSSAVGWEVELWDKDWETDDDFIGSWRTTAEGKACIVFEWEGEGYSHDEADPDLYIKMINNVRSIDQTSPTLHALNGEGDPIAQTSWRSCGDEPDSDVCVALNCSVGVECYLGPGSAWLITSPNAELPKPRALMIVDSAQRTLDVFGGDINDSSDIDFWIHSDVDDAIDDCNGSPACAFSETKAVLAASTHQAQAGEHELGHVLMMREFNDNTLSINDLLNGGGHAWGEVEFDSAATAEGWADYVAAVTWYDPAQTAVGGVSVVPKFVSYDVEEVEACEDASYTHEGEVARAFWDLDDVHNDSWEDGSNHTSRWLLNQWDDFPNGTADRHDQENDANGVNLWDYVVNAPLFELQDMEVLDENCMDRQEP